MLSYTNLNRGREEKVQQQDSSGRSPSHSPCLAQLKRDTSYKFFWVYGLAKPHGRGKL
jgi:hypothetical protein